MQHRNHNVTICQHCNSLLFAAQPNSLLALRLLPIDLGIVMAMPVVSQEAQIRHILQHLPHMTPSTLIIRWIHKISFFMSPRCHCNVAPSGHTLPASAFHVFGKATV